MSFRPLLVPGTILGRYELLLPVAQGGMASVWAARLKGSRGFAKTVAVKTMLPLLSDDPAFEEMFLQEAEIASRIQHPNVAAILDLGEEDETLFLVMEWLDGEPLSVLLKMARKNRVQVPLRVTLRIATQICAGLHAAHELRDDSDQPMGLVHRDVSPQNIMLNPDGLVKLVDFGIAKAVARAGAETGAGTVKGKVPYLAPEQIKGRAIDRRTDIFALGVILYRMTTGSHPFLGDTDSHTMRNTVSRPVLPPHVKHPTFCRPLEKVILRCLQKEPEKRFETMAAVERALEEVMLDQGLGLVPYEEVTTFVRGLLGEREKKRRVALRDAARAIDARLPVGEEIFEIPDEDVSGLLLTETVTPTSDAGASASDVHASLSEYESDPSLRPESAGTGGRRTPATNLTAAMMPAVVGEASARRRLMWLLAVPAVLGLGLLGARQLVGASSVDAAPVDPSPGAAEAPGEDPISATGPSDDGSDDGARAQRSGPAAQGSAELPGIKLDELPTIDPASAESSPARAPAKPKSKKARRKPRREPSESVDATSANSGAPSQASAPPDEPWVPTVQDPGF